VAVSQRTDELLNRMKMIVKMRQGADLPSEVMDRSGFRVISVKNFNDYQFENMPGIPPESWEHEKQIMMMLQMLEPAMIDFGSNSQAVPDAQKVATLGLLQKQSQDSLASDEMQQLDQSLADEAEIKLYMLQQSMQDQLKIPDEFFPSVATLKAGDTNATGPRVTTLRPLDIQQDFQVFAEAFSTLASDDLDKVRAANEIYATASANPKLWNLRKAAELKAQTFRGHTAEELLNQQPPQSIPIPKFTVNWKDLSQEQRAMLMQKWGLQIGPGQQLALQVDQLEKLHEGAEHLNALQEPEGPPEEEGGEVVG
jgi:hypothetical protein